MVGFPAIFFACLGFQGSVGFQPTYLKCFQIFRLSAFDLKLIPGFRSSGFRFRPLTLSFILLFPFCFLFLEGLDVGLFGGGAVEVAVELFG